MHVTVSFSDPRYPAVCLPRGAALSEHLTVQNSPVLFGCRTGVCGTCASILSGDVPPPADEEREVLEVIDHPHPRARLLCQVELTADVEIGRITP
jgi:ferredoxin